MTNACGRVAEPPAEFVTTTSHAAGSANVRSKVVLRNLPPTPTVEFVPTIVRPAHLSCTVVPARNPVPTISGLTVPAFPPVDGVIPETDRVWLDPNGNFVTNASAGNCCDPINPGLSAG